MTKNPIKGVVFDMDGVLIDARHWHFAALNFALEKFGERISEQDHHARFDGLPTRTKLEVLTKERGFPRALHGLVSEIKQVETMRMATMESKINFDLITLLDSLSKRNIKLGVATNSIKLTTEMFLTMAGIRSYFQFVLTNEDVERAKPEPDIYLSACLKMNENPSEILVVEDSEYGIMAAKAAGCRVLAVEGPSNVNSELVLPLLAEGAT